MRAMSIIGIIWFSFSIIGGSVSSSKGSAQVAAGWAIMASLYGLAFAIVALVKLHQPKAAQATLSSEELATLHGLKEEGIISEDEFNQTKAKILSKL